MVKKSTSFRVEEDVLEALAAKADRLSEETGRTYSVATIVDAALSVAVAQADRDTLSVIAKHQFGIELVREPEPFEGLRGQLASLTIGRGDEPPRLLAADWGSLAKDVPIPGLNEHGISHGLMKAGIFVSGSPDKAEVLLDKYVSKKGGNELVHLLYRLIELQRGTDDQQELLTKLCAYYCFTSIFADSTTKDHPADTIADSLARGDAAMTEMIRQFAEMAQGLSTKRGTKNK